MKTNYCQWKYVGSSSFQTSILLSLFLYIAKTDTYMIHFTVFWCSFMIFQLLFCQSTLFSSSPPSHHSPFFPYPCGRRMRQACRTVLPPSGRTVLRTAIRQRLYQNYPKAPFSSGRTGLLFFWLPWFLPAAADEYCSAHFPPQKKALARRYRSKTCPPSPCPAAYPAAAYR